MKFQPVATYIGVLILASLTGAAHAVVLGQIDNFQDGTTQGWANGAVPDPVNIPNGGPLGAGDNFLQITADGSGSGGKLTAFNRSQWLGDYITAGVTGIELDLKGFSSPGSASLSLRLVFKPSAGGGSGYVSTNAFSLPIDGTWHHAVFSLSAMTAVGSPAPLNTLLAAPGDFRIINAAVGNTVNGDTLVAQIGVDNVQAAPEPTTAVLGLLGAGLLGLRRRATVRPA